MELATRLMRVTSLATEGPMVRVGGYFLEGPAGQALQHVKFSFLTNTSGLPRLNEELIITISQKPKAEV